MTFSDGEPLNAAAVVANITLWAKGDPKRGIAKVVLFPALYFEKATAVNSTTAEVDFSKPTLGSIPTLGYHGSILLARKTLALSVNQQANLSNEIGSGPFVVKSFQTGVSYTLVKRADYNRGPAALGHTGPAYLDSLTYKVVADESTREQAVVAGDAQADFNVTPSDIPSLEGQGFTVGTPRYLGFVDGFEVDAGVAPTNSLQVRQALQHAINRSLIPNPYVPSTQQEDELIAQQFQKVGIKAQLKVVPLSNYASVNAIPHPPLLSVSPVAGDRVRLKHGQTRRGREPGTAVRADAGILHPRRANLYTAWLS